MTKKKVIRTAKRAINALKDLHEDAYSCHETADTARGYLVLYSEIDQIEKFIKAIEK